MFGEEISPGSWKLLTSFDGILNDDLRGFYRSTYKDHNGDEQVIATTTNGRPAAFLAETIQGAGGYIVPPPGYFQRVAEIIRGVGGYLIIDEVQTGFGRTGDWFTSQVYDVKPDVMVLGNGY